MNARQTAHALYMFQRLTLAEVNPHLVNVAMTMDEYRVPDELHESRTPTWYPPGRVQLRGGGNGAREANAPGCNLHLLSSRTTASLLTTTRKTKTPNRRAISTETVLVGMGSIELRPSQQWTASSN